jgi:hypothetical protein
LVPHSMPWLLSSITLLVNQNTSLRILATSYSCWSLLTFSLQILSLALTSVFPLTYKSIKP